MQNLTKIIVMDDQKVTKELARYEGQLIPMMGDLIDVPKIGIKEVCKRVFDVKSPDEVYIFVK